MLVVQWSGWWLQAHSLYHNHRLRRVILKHLSLTHSPPLSTFLTLHLTFPFPYSPPPPPQTKPKIKPHTQKGTLNSTEFEPVSLALEPRL